MTDGIVLLLATCFAAIQQADAQPATTAPATAPATAPPESSTITTITSSERLDLGDRAVTLFGPTLSETTIYGWLTLLGGVVAGVAVGRIAQSLLVAIAGRLERRGWSVRSAILRHAGGPANLALIALGLGIGLTGVHMTDDVRLIAFRVVALFYVLAITWYAYNLVAMVEIVLRRLVLRTRTPLDDAILLVVRKALRVFLVVMMSLFIAENIFGAHIGTWLAGLGIAGLAVSLAAQDPIKNLFGSFTMLVERPFGLGDRIIFNNIDGTVEEIGLRSTRIRSMQGHLVAVPNMKFTDSVIENISRRPSVQRTLNLAIAYDTPPEKIAQALAIVRSILNEPAVSAAFNLPDQPPRVVFNEFSPDSLNIVAVYWYAINRPGNDWWTFQAHNEMINLKIVRGFSEAGIDFAFPARTLYWKPEARVRTSV